MKNISKTSAAAMLLVLTSIPSFAGNSPLTCWYGEIGDFTSASPGDSGKTIGSVGRSGRGDKSFSYIISARTGTACPLQLPLSTEKALTIALVRQESESCSNDDVSDAAEVTVVGSVTVFPATYDTNSAGVRLAGALPNTNYRIFIKCGKQLGSLRTDAEGNGGRTVNYLTNSLSPAYAFEIMPDGVEAGAKLQSLTLKK
ncbi:MAG: hypothetical protein L0Y57_14685 [Beijerinckiaceae bacterium]|nr:hypothetical protein [Beijerinckiaceae bacterium]